MANAKNQAKITFLAETENFRKGVDSARSSITEINSVLKLLDAEMKNSGESAENLAQKTDFLKEKLDEQKKVTDNLISQLDSAKRNYGENSVEVQKLETQINNSLTAEQRIEAQIKATNEQIQKQAAECKEADAQLEKSEQSMAELRSELEKSESSYKNNASSVEALTDKKRILQQMLETSGNKVEALRQKLQKSEEVFGKNSTEVSKLKTQLNNAEREYSDLENAIEDTNKDLDNADPKTKAAKKALDDLADATDKSSDGFTVMKGVLVDLVNKGIDLLIDGLKEAAKYVLRTGMDFEAGMSQVKAVSGASAQEMVQLEQKAKQMGASTKFSATEAAEAFNYMAMAGWKTGDMLDGIEGIMDLAAAAGADLGTASDIVTDALTAMGYAAKDAGKLADVMAAASSNANTNVELMGYTFKYVAPVVGALGYSMEDLAIATGLMANAGIKGEQAGTSMRAALTNLVGPSEAVAKQMQALGFYTEEVVDTFDEQKIDQQMVRVEKATLKVEQAQSAYTAAVNKYGKESDQAAQKAMALGIAKDELRIASEKLVALQEGEKKVIYGVNEAIMNQDGSMKTLRETLVYLREKFADMSEAEQAAAASAIFGKEAMSGMLAIINASDEDFENLVLAIDDSEGAAKRMADTMQDNLKGDIEELGGALETVGIQAYEGFSQPMRNAVQSVTETLNSYDVAKLVHGISYEIGQLMEKIASKLPGAINGVVGFLQKLIDNIDSIIAGIKAFVVTWAIIKGLSIAMSIGSVIAQVGSLITGLISGKIALAGVTAALGGTSAALAAATAGISIIVGAIVGLVAHLVTSASKSDEFSDSFLRSANSLTEFQWGLNNLQPSLSGTEELVSSFGNSMKTLQDKIRTAEEGITAIMYDEQGKQKALRDTDIQQIKEYYAEIQRLKLEQLEIQRQQQEIELLQLQRKLEKEGALTQEAAAQAIVDANAAYEQSAQATQEFYDSEFARIVAHHKQMGTYESEAMQAELDALDAKLAEETAKNEAARDETLRIVASEATEWVKMDAQKWDDLANGAYSGKKEYKEIMESMNMENTKAFMQMVSTAKSQGVELTDETKEIARDVLGAFKNLPDKLEESGKDALLGMISGLEGQIPGLENASEMTADEIVETLERELQINSPSRVTKKIGGYVAEGLAVGMENKQGPLGSRIKTFASGLISKIESAFGVASPSKVTAEIGGFLSEGLGVGIEKNADAAIKPMQDIVDSITGIDAASEWSKLSGASGSLSYDVSAQLGDYVSSAIDRSSPYALLASLIDTVEDLANRPIDLSIDGHRFATATAGASDNVSGNRLTLKARGLAL